jgi:hypothetical protein
MVGGGGGLNHALVLDWLEAVFKIGLQQVRYWEHAIGTVYSIDLVLLAVLNIFLYIVCFLTAATVDSSLQLSIFFIKTEGTARHFKLTL